MILNKGHWNWSDSVNDDFLCCLHISVMKTSYHVLPSFVELSMLFTALWLKINPTDSSPKCSWSLWTSTSAGGATVKDDAFSYRSGICAFNPTNKGMWKMCKHTLQDFFMHLTFSSSCSLSIFLLIYIMFVNAYAFFFLLHVGSLYLWHKSLFLCNHCFFLSFNFCKKKKKSPSSWFHCLCQLCVQ